MRFFFIFTSTMFLKMEKKIITVADYLAEVQHDKLDAFITLRETIIDNLPTGFVEQISYGTIGYLVPHSLYKAGYHCDPRLPLPFINIATQKNSITMYHMGVYYNPEILNWFVASYPKYGNHKIDMGKSCIRFKKIDQIPYELIAELIKKISVEDWIADYEKNLKK